LNACATIGPARRSGVSDDPGPVVLVDGVPESRLVVASYLTEGPMDVRSTRLYIDEPDRVPGVLTHWLGAEVSIELPMRLTDGRVRWAVLLRGELKEVEADEASGERGRWLRLIDTWDDFIARPTQTIWWRNPDGSVIQRDMGSFKVGDKGNRSVGKYIVNGGLVHVIQDGSGLAWTVGDALETISAFSGLSLSLNGLPRNVADSELMQSVDLARSLSIGLKKILETYELVIQRDINRESGVTTERRAVRPVSCGRPIRISWADSAEPLGDVLSVNTDQPVQPAQLWVAQAGGWLVESTFDLDGGWAPALEGQSDDEYDKKKSTDFATYADVYRRWVLNEDGFYSQAPYYHGPTFDLNALFNATGIDPQPLAFQPNVTLGEDGERLKPIIEVSTDGGSEWIVFTQSKDILDDRAGIYLDPNTLPGDYLTAVKAGQARVRVTAGLISPVQVEISRWYGNAFTGKLPPLVLDVSDFFSFRAVSLGSIHHTDVQSGALAAAEIDDSNAMLRWLVDRIARRAEGGSRNGGRATLELAGTWSMLRSGDRLLDVRGSGVAADGQAQSMTPFGGTVLSVEARYMPTGRKGRTTTVRLAY
jgi:hypothetical protein